MIQPLGKRCLLLPQVEEKPKIILTQEQPPKYYDVVSVGSDVTKVAAGDIVIISPYGHHILEDEGKKYIVILDDDIVAKKI